MPLTFEKIFNNYKNIHKGDWYWNSFAESILRSEANPSDDSQSVQRRYNHLVPAQRKLFSKTYVVDDDTRSTFEFLGKSVPEAKDVNILTVMLTGTQNLEYVLRMYFRHPSREKFFNVHNCFSALVSYLKSNLLITHRKLKLEFIAWLIHEMDTTFIDRALLKSAMWMPAPLRADFYRLCAFACNDAAAFRHYTDPAYEDVIKNRIFAHTTLFKADKNAGSSVMPSSNYSFALVQSTYYSTYKVRIASCTQFAPIAVYVLSKNLCRGTAKIISSNGHNFVHFTRPDGAWFIIDPWLGSVGRQFCYAATDRYPIQVDPDDFENPVGEFSIPN